MDLLEVLKNLIPCIKGKWFIGDGALLGITRSGGLIPYDHDIDLYIFEDTEIDLTNSELEEQDYYVCKKIYSPKNIIKKKNTWHEWISVLKPHYPHYDQQRIYEYAATNTSECGLYKENKIIPKFTENHIDIFILYKKNNSWQLPPIICDKMKIPYYQSDLELTSTNVLGFPVNIPNNAEEVLERQYGYDWRHPNKNFKYY
tara:strand:+ start:91 stop:693 length:603 start_codon:yes stop_codon:yes gene_type:complete